MDKWFDKSKPLWMPTGTVRALLALWIIVAGTAYEMINGADIHDIILIALGWYAIDKAYQKGASEPPAAQ